MIRRKFLSLELLFLFSSFFISCASNPPPVAQKNPTTVEIMGQIESSKQVKAMNEMLLMSSLSSKTDLFRDYRIGPEDLLEISVFEDDKLNKTVRVSSQGNISLPLLGILRVRGLTAYELEKEIRELLAEKYLQDPHVTVFIREYRNQQISVIGAVDKPGVYEVKGQKTILDLLAMAGGLSSGPEKDAGQLLFLIRPPKLEEEMADEKKDSDGQTPKTFVIDLEKLLIQGDFTLNLPLVHGDVINIPASGKVFVGGEVRRPGGFSLKGKKMTVTQAIAMAEGLKPEANGSGLKVFRYAEGQVGKEIISVNLHAIQKGTRDDLYLKENDIIIVPKSGVKTFLIELRETMKGLIGFGFSLGGL
ncbi:MAG: polysaccharide biosynthesis/export family protein [Syntrophaceae bacterium]|nr:polysaccharide biosynthesis/export family protein [Syntrophaceae bacterium]